LKTIVLLFTLLLLTVLAVTVVAEEDVWKRYLDEGQGKDCSGDTCTILDKTPCSTCGRVDELCECEDEDSSGWRNLLDR
jgi:hypothetical protein